MSASHGGARAPRPRPAAQATFPTIKSQFDGGDKLAQVFANIYSDLWNAHADYTCVRLHSLDAQVGKLGYDVIYSIVDPDRARDEVDENVSARTRHLITARNVLALVPLLLTWIALGLATIFYDQEITADKSKLTTPFLDLWQTGFGGRFFLNFAWTAFFDFGVLLAVLGVTIGIAVSEANAERKVTSITGDLAEAMKQLAIAKQSYEARLGTTAKEWANEVQRAIGDATTVTKNVAEANAKTVAAAQKALQDMTTASQTFIEGLKTQVSDLLRTLKEEYVQFIAVQTRNVSAALQTMGDANRQLIDEDVKPVIKTFSDTAIKYEASGTTLTDKVKVLGDAADILAASSSHYTVLAESIDNHLTTLNDGQAEFVKQVTAAATDMKAAAGGAITIAEELDTAMRPAVLGMGHNVVRASRALANVEAQLERTTEQLERVARRFGGPPPPSPPPGGPGPTPPPVAPSLWERIKRAFGL